MDEQKPGEVIAPGAQPTPSQTGAYPQEPQPQGVPATPSPSPVMGTMPTVVTQAESPVGEPAFMTQSADASQQPQPEQTQDVIRWQAQEGSAHEGSAKWFVALLFGAAVVAVVLYFLTRDIVSSIAVLVGAVALLYFSARKAGVQQYGLVAEGVYVGDKLYPYGDYRAFSAFEEAGQVTFTFVPLKRFMPPLIIYADPQTATSVLAVLSSVLAHEEHKPDVMDSLVRRLRA